MNDILGLKFVYVDTSVRGGRRKTFCFLWRVQQGPAAGAGNFCSYFTWICDFNSENIMKT